MRYFIKCHFPKFNEIGICAEIEEKFWYFMLYNIQHYFIILFRHIFRQPDIK